MSVYPIKVLTTEDIPEQILQDKFEYTTLSPGQNIYENGNALLQAYYGNLDRGKYTIFLLPGTYDLSGRNLELKSNNVKIIGLSNPELVKIQSEFSGKGSGVLHQTSNSIHLENLSVQNIFSGIENYWDPNVQSAENPITNNILNNNCYIRSAFSSSSSLSFRTGSKIDPFAKIYDQIYIFDSGIDSYRIAYKQRVPSNVCEYFVQEYPTQEEIGALSLQNNYVDLNPLQFSRLKGGVWKLISGSITGESVLVNSVLAIENPSLNPDFSPQRYMSTFYETKSWPWLVNSWLNYSNLSILPQKAYVISSQSYCKNVNFMHGHTSLGMNAPSYYGGTFIDCKGAMCTFGGNGGYLEGKFLGCTAEDYSFAPKFHRHGEVAVNNAEIRNCVVGGYSLGAMGKIEKSKIYNTEVGDKDKALNNMIIGKLSEDSISINLMQYGRM